MEKRKWKKKMWRTIGKMKMKMKMKMKTKVTMKMRMKMNKKREDESADGATRRLRPSCGSSVHSPANSSQHEEGASEVLHRDCPDSHTQAENEDKLAQKQRMRIIKTRSKCKKKKMSGRRPEEEKAIVATHHA